MCDACITQNPDLFYSMDYFAVMEQRLAAARSRYHALADKGIGDDVRSNPTKGAAGYGMHGRTWKPSRV